MSNQSLLKNPLKKKGGTLVAGFTVRAVSGAAVWPVNLRSNAEFGGGWNAVRNAGVPRSLCARCGVGRETTRCSLLTRVLVSRTELFFEVEFIVAVGWVGAP